jgi:AGCS family alanine or glycine:cation symporter
MNFESIISNITDIIWGNALIFACLGIGLFFSIMTRFVQVRIIKEMARLLFDKSNKDKIGVSSFQAFSMGIAGRVGVGNIVGVATAIAMGGPGAVF